MGWNEMAVWLEFISGKNLKWQRFSRYERDIHRGYPVKILDYIETLNTDKWSIEEHEVFDFDDTPQHTIRSGIQIVSY
jgi:hypothetical protein